MRPKSNLGNDSSVTFKSGIGGVKLDVRLDKDGVSVNPGEARTSHDIEPD
jgi:hypothetical protein